MIDIEATRERVKSIGDRLAALSNEAEHGFAQLTEITMELVRELESIRAADGIPQTGLTFSQALSRLKAGALMRRKGWATKGAHIKIHRYPDLRVSDCIAWCMPGSYIQPGWTCSQADMLADDWEVCGQAEAG